MFSNQNLLAGLALLIFGVLTLTVLIPYGVQKPDSVQLQALAPSFWPNIVALAIAAIGLALTITTLLAERRSKDRNRAPDHVSSPSAAPTQFWLACRPFVALAICFALYFSLEPLGFVLACAIALVALMMLAGEYRPQFILPIAVLVPFGLHLFFTKAASVPIPMGILEPWLLRI
ncbi:MAG: putative tricarboxylic transport membrane protein [Hyphomicrobiaceae bacterium]|jgi:putative tricarboxylic transport membrane protein